MVKSFSIKAKPQSSPVDIVKTNIDEDFRSGALNCSEYENVCVFDVAKYKKETGKDLNMRQLKKHLGLPDKVLTTGEAGKKNDFYMGSYGTGSYDTEKPADLKKPLAALGNWFTGRTPVYVPKSEITEHQ